MRPLGLIIETFSQCTSLAYPVGEEGANKNIQITRAIIET